MKRTPDGARINLQEAIALLLHNQAQFVSQMAESERRFAAIERELYEIKRTIHEMPETLSRELSEKLLRDLLRELPEAVRQKIGFKPK